MLRGASAGQGSSFLGDGADTIEFTAVRLPCGSAHTSRTPRVRLTAYQGAGEPLRISVRLLCACAAPVVVRQVSAGSRASLHVRGVTGSRSALTLTGDVELDVRVPSPRRVHAEGAACWQTATMGTAPAHPTPPA